MLHLLALQEASSTQSAEVTVSHMLSHQIETIVRWWNSQASFRRHGPAGSR